MNAKIFVSGLLVFIVAAGIALNQWRLDRALKELRSASGTAPSEFAAALQQSGSRVDEANARVQATEQRLAMANAQIANLEQRLKQLEGSARTQSGPRRTASSIEPVAPAAVGPDPAENAAPARRPWGPEQAAGPPDTAQAGDISTAWASRNPDGGEEWLKLDYERAVEIAEVRIRETYNPGAVSRVAAIVGNMEQTIWEGVEPRAEAPVEVSFDVPSGVVAGSIKVYLDTRRVPGWNEIDAVELVGRDGSRQWAKQAGASSTYAER